MSKAVAIMSMSLGGYVADRNDGVAELFDWYFTSGDVEIHTVGSNPMTCKVSGPSAEHLRGLACPEQASPSQDALSLLATWGATTTPPTRPRRPRTRRSPDRFETPN